MKKDPQLKRIKLEFYAIYLGFFAILLLVMAGESIIEWILSLIFKI